MSTTATTRILHTAPNAKVSAAPRSWVWPLPRLDGVAPSIIATGSGQPPLDGITIGYPGRSLPGLVPVFAAQDGVITYAGNTADGSTLCIDHAGGWSTQYSELEHLLARPTDRFRRRRKERVRAGDVIGHACRSSLRIRFGLSRLTDEGSVDQDPSSWMLAWSLLPWFAEPMPRVVARAAV
jgi:murein DD-endopeptidase MepM/ murein hydrolase activator NlpD